MLSTCIVVTDCECCGQSCARTNCRLLQSAEHSVVIALQNSHLNFNGLSLNFSLPDDSSSNHYFGYECIRVAERDSRLLCCVILDKLFVCEALYPTLFALIAPCSLSLLLRFAPLELQVCFRICVLYTVCFLKVATICEL